MQPALSRLKARIAFWADLVYCPPGWRTRSVSFVLTHVDGAHYFLARRLASPPSPFFEGSRQTMSADTTLTCRDCGQAFTFTSGEQDFYASRGFSEPSRCADCRAARKAQRDGGSYSSYGSSSSSYGGGGGGGYSSGGGG